LYHAVHVVGFHREHAGILREDFGDEKFTSRFRGNNLEVVRWLDLKVVTVPGKYRRRVSLEVDLKSARKNEI